jgi:dolichyl-phosphate-mannose--protein O-mannosyl transferase
VLVFHLLYIIYHFFHLLLLTMILSSIVVVVVVVLCALSLIPQVYSSSSDKSPVTCGSAIKLKHKETGNNLHSHQIAWGSGSGQQSVTTTGTLSDPGSLWIVKVINYTQRDRHACKEVDICFIHLSYSYYLLL